MCLSLKLWNRKFRIFRHARTTSNKLHVLCCLCLLYFSQLHLIWQCVKNDASHTHKGSLLKHPLLPQVQVNGLTGLIKFDTEGFRRDVTLDIVELAKEGLSRVGRCVGVCVCAKAYIIFLS